MMMCLPNFHQILNNRRICKNSTVTWSLSVDNFNFAFIYLNQVVAALSGTRSIYFRHQFTV